MPEAVDHNPDLDAAVATCREVLPILRAAAFPVLDPAALDLVLDALADYRARRATGGPAPANTPTGVNVATPGPAPDETIPLPKETT